VQLCGQLPTLKSSVCAVYRAAHVIIILSASIRSTVKMHASCECMITSVWSWKQIRQQWMGIRFEAFQYYRLNCKKSHSYTELIG